MEFDSNFDVEYELREDILIVISRVEWGPELDPLDLIREFVELAAREKARGIVYYDNGSGIPNELGLKATNELVESLDELMPIAVIPNPAISSVIRERFNALYVVFNNLGSRMGICQNEQEALEWLEE